MRPSSDSSTSPTATPGGKFSEPNPQEVTKSYTIALLIDQQQPEQQQPAASAAASSNSNRQQQQQQQPEQKH